MVMEAICILLNEKSDWNSAKSILMDINFIDRLKKYDKNKINDKILTKARPIILKTEFDPDIVGAKSNSCKSLSLWCRAIDNYARISKEVEPKKKHLEEMNTKLQIQMKELSIKTHELSLIK